MTKKKHRKKTSSAKHGARRKVAKHTARAHGVNHSRHKIGIKVHAKAGHHSLPLLRAIKRRRAAQNGEPLDLERPRGSAHHAHKKRGKAHLSRKNGTHHAEPVITEKSFENMLAYRRFQDHAR